MLKKNITKVSNQLFIKLKRYWPTIIGVGVVAILALYLAYTLRNQLNPDGVSYIQIAKHYANLDITKAINGYWSPLISWLLVPFVWLGIEPLHGFKIINILICLTGITVLGVALQKSLDQKYHALVAPVIVATGIPIVYWATSVATPDVLSGFCLLLSLVTANHFIKYPTKLNGTLFGISLATIYFSKSIGLYISIAMLASVFLMLYKKYTAKGLLKLVAIPTLVFAFFSVSWITALSIKYDTITASTAGPYNMSLAGPEHPSHPIDIPDKVLETNDTTDVWVWDDPSYFTMPAWKPLNNMSYFLNRFFTNLSLSFNYLFTLTPLMSLLVISLFIGNTNKKLRLLIGVVTLLCLLAYSAVLIEERYLWLVAVPIMFITIYQLSMRYRYTSHSTWLAWLLVFINLIVLLPDITSARAQSVSESSFKALAMISANQVQPQARIAGDQGRYRYCYFTETNCVGNFSLKGKQISEVERSINEMRQNNIEYYVETEPYNPTYRLPAAYIGQAPIAYSNGLFDIQTSSQSLTVYRLK